MLANSGLGETNMLDKLTNPVLTCGEMPQDSKA